MFTTHPGIELSQMPDGMPHLKMDLHGGGMSVRITNPADLFGVALAANVNDFDYLSIMYLMGSRMDRRIDATQPYTLKAVCDLLNAIPVKQYFVFGYHSLAVFDLLRDSRPMLSHEQEAHLSALCREMTERDDKISIVLPDEGALKRFERDYKTDMLDPHPNVEVVLMHKKREMRTGKILGHKIVEGKIHKKCIIIDDLCDGGATFISAAAMLRENGAERVTLSVLHGVFSKGRNLQGIDHIYTTNSFASWESDTNCSVLKVM